MKLKTYTADTMAQALAQVRKELGKDAMILHTRSYRVGSWFGLGGKNMVEITASSPTLSTKKPSPRHQPRVEQPRTTVAPAERQERQPEIVVQRGRTLTRQRLAHSAIEAKPLVAAVENDRTRSSETNGTEGRDALFSDVQQRTQPPKRELPRMDHKELRIRQERPRMQDPTQTPTTREPAGHPEAKAIPQPAVTPTPSATPTPASDQASSDENAQLRAQLESMQKMMGQVLESTRKTAVAFGSGSSEASLPNGEMPAPLFALYRQMLDNDVPVELCDQLVGTVRDRLDRAELRDPIVVRQALLREIESTIRTRSESLLNIDHRTLTDRPRVIALIGPTGVGKTTTVAKLAATYKLRHQKKVGLITSDTYRIAAVEQLKTYAGIIGLPLKVANSPEEMRQAVESLQSCDIIVVDTAGRSQNDRQRLAELAEFSAAANPDETHLVLSTTVGDNVLRKTAERFRALGPDRCILTKLDEAVTTGPIAGLCDRIGLPLSFVTVGQEVPDDIEPARADRLARCVLDGPDALLRREDEENG